MFETKEYKKYHLINTNEEIDSLSEDERDEFIWFVRESIVRCHGYAIYLGRQLKRKYYKEYNSKIDEVYMLSYLIKKFRDGIDLTIEELHHIHQCMEFNKQSSLIVEILTLGWASGIGLNYERLPEPYKEIFLFYKNKKN